MNPNPRVCISSFGRFHTFDLAKCLEARGMLERLFTGYPKSRVGIAPAHVEVHSRYLLATMGLGKLGLDRFQHRLSVPSAKDFDDWVADRLTNCDVFHCLSGFGVRSHEVARRFGALTVCDHGSSHVRNQRDLLLQEGERWDTTLATPPEELIARQEHEYKLCDRILVPSTYARQTFLERGVSSSKVSVIPYGVDTSLFSPQARKDRRFRVIYVGRVGLNKGVPYLLEAMKILKNSIDVDLWLVGSVLAEAKPILKRYIGLFHAFGHVDRSKLAALFSQASVAVMPSIDEGLALVILQAMACGLPVVATDHTGGPDVISDGSDGFIVPIRDPSAIAEKIALLYDDPDKLAMMSANAESAAKRANSWDTYGDAVLQAYERGSEPAPHS